MFGSPDITLVVKQEKQTNERTHDQTFYFQWMKLFCKCVDEMKYFEIIPDFLSMYGVFTSQNTSWVRQEMSIRRSFTQMRNTWYGIGDAQWISVRN